MGNEEINKAWEQFILGDQRAFGEIYKVYFPLLTMFCLGKLKDMEEAENCASEALLKTMKYEKPDEIRDLDNWLFSIARNICYSQIAKTNRRQDIMKHINTEAKRYQLPDAEMNEKMNDYENALKENLKDEDRQLWKLHLEGYSNQEIARKMDMNEKTVANRKSEIRLVLRKALKELN